MKISIITPTIQRQSLIRCCESVDAQTFSNWEHVIMVDCEEFDRLLIEKIEETPSRVIYKCPIPHNNYGNTCRHNAWTLATGDWVLYLDCDNFLSHPDVLSKIASSIESNVFFTPQWAIFPIARHGHRFFSDPPGLCKTDTANMVIRREIAQWPDGPEYTMDGIFCENLLKSYPYAAFPSVNPIVVMEASNLGK
jgi:glycosyltransferase involved in cell wall biosynthesis